MARDPELARLEADTGLDRSLGYRLDQSGAPQLVVVESYVNPSRWKGGRWSTVVRPFTADDDIDFAPLINTSRATVPLDGSGTPSTDMSNRPILDDLTRTMGGVPTVLAAAADQAARRAAFHAKKSLETSTLWNRRPRPILAHLLTAATTTPLPAGRPDAPAASLLDALAVATSAMPTGSPTVPTTRARAPAVPHDTRRTI